MKKRKVKFCNHLAQNWVKFAFTIQIQEVQEQIVQDWKSFDNKCININVVSCMQTLSKSHHCICLRKLLVLYLF